MRWNANIVSENKQTLREPITTYTLTNESIQNGSSQTLRSQHDLTNCRQRHPCNVRPYRRLSELKQTDDKPNDSEYFDFICSKQMTNTLSHSQFDPWQAVAWMESSGNENFFEFSAVLHWIQTMSARSSQYFRDTANFASGSYSYCSHRTDQLVGEFFWKKKKVILCIFGMSSIDRVANDSEQFDSIGQSHSTQSFVRWTSWQKIDK